MKYYEVNFDGQIAKTHRFSGLSAGNLASAKNKDKASDVNAARSECRQKQERLKSLGILQFELPMVNRPSLKLLTQLGFNGDIQTQLKQLKQCSNELYSAWLSASAMWAANAATVSPSPDTADGKVHITPANLNTFFHRQIETEYTAQNLQTLFSNSQYFTHHMPLPNHNWFADEGSANHLRICPQHLAKAINIFVYGFDPFYLSFQHAVTEQALNTSEIPTKYPARQSLQASMAIARLHQLDPNMTLFVQQHPQAIDAGVFHNDVISVANENVFLYHELAFVEPEKTINRIKALYQSHYPTSCLFLIKITNRELSLAAAVQSYMFNSQLLTLADKSMLLLCPIQCKQNMAVQAVIDRILAQHNPIKRVEYVNLSQSMANGGGPACLRLRMVLSEAELASLNLPD
ncbi:N-succinylarginine dihydrolase [Catenovulum sediminis]|uniref:N-succinylarginine dihydrolase n=1 Tax=Catenovulum sediminis TaxID=1740262 RepID=A0ABV1RJ76_9ALTE